MTKSEKESWINRFETEGIENVRRDYNDNRYLEEGKPEIHELAKEWINKKLQSQKPKYGASRNFKSQIAGWVFGSILLIFLIMVFIYVPCFTEDRRAIARFLMALTGGLFTYFFVGNVVLEGKLKDLAISATGGLAIFVIIQFIVNPFPNTNCNDGGITPDISFNSNQNTNNQNLANQAVNESKPTPVPGECETPEENATKEKLNALIQICSSEIERNPNDVDAIFNRGLAYSRTKNFDKAIADYTTLIGKDKENNVFRPDVLHNRGNAYFERNSGNDISNAIADFQEALKFIEGKTDKESIDEKNWLLSDLGYAFNKIGRRNEAIEAFQRICKESPTSERCTTVKKDLNNWGIK